MIETKPETITSTITPETVTIDTKQSSRAERSTRTKKVSYNPPIPKKTARTKKSIKKKEKKVKPINNKAELIVDEHGNQMWKCAFCNKKFEKTV